MCSSHEHAECSLSEFKPKSLEFKNFKFLGNVSLINFPFIALPVYLLTANFNSGPMGNWAAPKVHGLSPSSIFVFRVPFIPKVLLPSTWLDISCHLIASRGERCQRLHSSLYINTLACVLLATVLSFVWHLLPHTIILK